MKKIIYVAILIALTSCNQNKSNKNIVGNAIGESIMEESYQTDNDTIEPFQTQAEINEACTTNMLQTKTLLRTSSKSYWKPFLNIGKSS